jgi:hypothetical protein
LLGDLGLPIFIDISVVSHGRFLAVNQGQNDCWKMISIYFLSATHRKKADGDRSGDQARGGAIETAIRDSFALLNCDLRLKKEYGGCQGIRT